MKARVPISELARPRSCAEKMCLWTIFEEKSQWTKVMVQDSNSWPCQNNHKWPQLRRPGMSRVDSPRPTSPTTYLVENDVLIKYYILIISMMHLML